jgi:transposase
MLTLPGSVRILLFTEPTDMRKGVDGLSRIAEDAMGGDIYSGALFVFVSRRRDRLKILTWDAGGFVVYYKRLEAGRFKMPRVESGARAAKIDAAQLTMLLRGIDLSRVRKPILWEPAPAV